MRSFLTRQRRTDLSFFTVAVWLIAFACALPACTSLTSHCDAFLPPDANASLHAANGVTYIGVHGSVRAVRTTDGFQLWQEKTDGNITLDNGVLYSGDGTLLRALRANDGKLLWQFQGAGLSSPRRIPPLVADGIVYVVSTVGLSAVHASDGRLLWHYPLTVVGRPWLVLDNHVLYVSSHDSLSALRPSDGKLLWFTSQPTFTFTVSDGKVFTYSLTTAVALRSSDGQLLWSFNLRTTSGTENSTMTPTPAGIVYVNTLEMLYALDAREGKLLWSAPADGHMKPVVVGNVLYMLSADDHISALNASDGSMLWKYAPASVYNVLADANSGVIYALGFDAGLQKTTAFALKMSDGSSVWQSADASGQPLLVKEGLVYFTLSSISCDMPLTVGVDALQTRNGKNRWHVHLQP